MAKKTTYNDKTNEALVLELAKLRDGLAAAHMEKRKNGKALAYRTTRRNIARVLTAMKANTAAQLPAGEK
jgi:ribosomal protein L29